MNDNLSFLERPRLEGGLSILGVPLDLGKENDGTDQGPKKIRELGLNNTLEEVGLSISDLADIECPNKKDLVQGDKRVKYLEPIIQVSERTAKVIEKEILKGNKVVVIGGDNTVSIGTIAGASAALRGELGVIWIDAHGDINTHETTLSGNIHGMPISAALGWGHPKLANAYKPGAKIKAEKLLYIGLKDLDQAEIDLIRAHKISAITMMDIMEGGLKPVFDAIRKLSQKTKNIWVCLDVDSIDEEFAPGTPMATRGGLTARESIAVAKFIGKTCPVVGIDVTEFAPSVDKDNKTGNLIIELIVNYFGTESNWYTKYMINEAKKQILKEVDSGSRIDFLLKK